MQQPEELVARFYDAFGQLDYAGMNSLYDSNIIFADPVFLVLEGDAVKDMWEMLCTHAKDFSLTYEPVNKLDEEYLPVAGQPVIHSAKQAGRSSTR